MGLGGLGDVEELDDGAEADYADDGDAEGEALALFST